MTQLLAVFNRMFLKYSMIQILKIRKGENRKLGKEKLINQEREIKELGKGNSEIRKGKLRNQEFRKEELRNQKIRKGEIKKLGKENSKHCFEERGKYCFDERGNIVIMASSSLSLSVDGHEEGVYRFQWISHYSVTSISTKEIRVMLLDTRLHEIRDFVVLSLS